MSADRGYWAEVGETSSVLRPMNTQALVRSAEEQGVSTYLHPILSYPFNPVVLVEGNNDEVVLNHVANVVGSSLLTFEIGRASCRERGVSTGRTRWSQYH